MHAVKIGIFFLSLLALSENSIAQNPYLLRETLSSIGTSNSVSVGSTVFLVQQSVGQSSVIGTNQNSNVTLRQGFIQSDAPIKRYSSNSQLKVNIFPNPFSDEFTVEIDSDSDSDAAFEIKILDLTGRQVYFNSAKTQFGVISISDFNLSSGSYIVQINSDNNSFSTTLVKS